MSRPRRLAIALVVAALAQPAFAESSPDNPHASGVSADPGRPAARGSLPADRPGPGATLAAKAKAYGRYCRNQSRQHVAGRRGTSFSRCVTAMAKLATGRTKDPWTACAPLSRKHLPGTPGSPFSRCVIAASRLLKDLRKP
jgi:hypothetical protein